MKNAFLIVLGFITLNTFSQNYFLADKSVDKNLVADFIQKSIKEQLISKNPVIVVDEKILNSEDLNTFSFYKKDIVSMSILTKEQSTLTKLYGTQSENGVIVIVTKQYQKSLNDIASREIENVTENVLYLLDGKKITKNEVSKIETYKIKSINVIKNPSEIAKYTSDSYEGVIIIDLKK